MDLAKWDLNLLDQLITYPDIESETFDFKGARLNELEIHICAMANTSGGVLVLGVEEPATPGQAFNKSGFDQSRKNTILNDIGNYTHKVEPHPKTDTKAIDDTNSKFYVLLKVEKKVTDLPYAIKDKGQFYVRVGASSRPASRNTVLNLFVGIFDKKRDVERLRSSCVATRNSFIQISRIIKAGNTNSAAKIPILDLTFLKAATIQGEWFLIEKGILGEIFENGSRSGMYTHLHSLEQMNAYIQGFNETFAPVEKQSILRELTAWGENRAAYNASVPFLEGVIKHCELFLKANELT